MMKYEHFLLFYDAVAEKEPRDVKEEGLTIGKCCSDSAAGKDNSQLCTLQLLQNYAKAYHSLSSHSKTTAFISAFRQLDLSKIDKISERQVLAGDPTFISLTQMQGKQTRDRNEYTITCTSMFLLCTYMWVTIKVHMHIDCQFFLELYSHLFYLAPLWSLSHVLILKSNRFNLIKTSPPHSL